MEEVTECLPPCSGFSIEWQLMTVQGEGTIVGTSGLSWAVVGLLLGSGHLPSDPLEGRAEHMAGNHFQYKKEVLSLWNGGGLRSVLVLSFFQ